MDHSGGIFGENCKRKGLGSGTQLEKIWETGCTDQRDQRHENGRLQQACSEENVTAVEQLRGTKPGRPDTHHWACPLSRKTSLASWGSFTMRLVWSVFLVCSPKCLFPIIVSFSYNYILQGSVAMQLRSGGVFNNRIILQIFHILYQWQIFKIGNIWWRYGQQFSSTFFMAQCILILILIRQ